MSSSNSSSAEIEKCYCLRCNYKNHLILITTGFIVYRMIKFYLIVESLLISTFILSTSEDFRLKYIVFDMLIFLIGFSMFLLRPIRVIKTNIDELQYLLYPKEEFKPSFLFQHIHNICICGYWATSMFLGKIILLSGFAEQSLELRI